MDNYSKNISEVNGRIFSLVKKLWKSMNDISQILIFDYSAI